MELNNKYHMPEENQEFFFKIKDVSQRAVVAGNPARTIKYV